MAGLRPLGAAFCEGEHIDRDLGSRGSELSKTTLFSLMLEQLQFPAPNRNPPLCFKGNTRGLRLRLGKMEELGLRAQITISTGFAEV